MKKGGIILLALTVVFVGFVAGILVGRNMDNNETTIQMSPQQPSAQTLPQAADETKLTEQLININTASAKLLETLPGIGPVLAQRIVAYRTEHGPFTHAEDISKVEGIGPEKLLDVLDYITVEG